MGILRAFRAIKSLILGLAILGLWGRSYFAGDLVRKGSDTQYIQLGSAWGSTVITFGHDGQPTRFSGSWQYVASREPRQMLADAGLGDSVWNRVGFGFKKQITYAPTRGMVVNLIAPHWLMFLLVIPGAVRWLRRRARESAAAADPRDAMYECPSCGQSFARIPCACPVCGQPMTAPKFT